MEKALGKILLTVISLTLGVAQMKSNKPGLGLCEKPFKIVPIILSVLSQTVARIFAIRSLILITSSLGYKKYAVFFVPHFLLVFIIKTLFETTSIKEKVSVRRGDCEKKKRPPRKSKRTRLWNCVKFVMSGISSTFVMIHLHEDRPATRKSHFSLVPHTLFFLLILLENLVLVLLPHLAPHLYPSLDCFTTDSRYTAIWVVLGLWVAGVGFHVVHYKWSHPWAKLNGLHSLGIWACVFTARVCWKPRVQRVSVKYIKYKKILIECEDFR